MTTLILARHGATAFTATGRYQGHRDEPLTDEGREQARSLGERLRRAWSADLGRARVWSSDLQRAHETALLALGGNGFSSDARLRELSFGRFEGYTALEIQEREPQAYQAWLATPEVSGGESLLELRSRLQHWLADIVDHPAVLAFTHGGAIRMLLSIATGESFDTMRSISIAPTDAVRLTLDNGRQVPSSDLQWLRAWEQESKSVL